MLPCAARERRDGDSFLLSASFHLKDWLAKKLHKDQQLN
jgi:hypothetical protein